MLIFVLFDLFLLSLADDEFKIVETSLGKVRGIRQNSYGGQSGFCFLGIPEAKPPVGDLRFRHAQDPLPWEGVLNATRYRSACLSDPIRTYKVNEGNAAGPVSEDCLYVNVFSSKTCLEKGGCAVYVIYHGGNFKHESPVIFRKEVIINNFANDERNLVVVTLPYRYGSIGLLHLSNVKTTADNNVGIDDCIVGLKWVQKEIKNFGGDPKRVTIGGHSGGGTIAYQLVISPKARGLFHQFVSQSGIIHYDMDFKGNIMASRLLAESFGCAKKGENYEKRKRVEEMELLNNFHKLNNRTEEMGWTWVDGAGGYLPSYRKQLYKVAPKVPCLIGTTTAEFRVARVLLDANENVNLEHLKEMCAFLGYSRGYHEPEKFTKECVEFYKNQNRTSLLDDDFIMYYGASQLAQLFTGKGANVFVYSYDYWGAKEVFKKYEVRDKYYGPSHSEDFVYILGLHRDDTKMTAKDYEIERTYTGMIANFVNTGDPSYNGYKWKPWTNKNRDFFLIDFDKNLRMPGSQVGYYPNVKEFWEEIVPKKIGDYTPLERFPKTQDAVLAIAVIDGMGPAFGDLLPGIKSANASIDLYYLWKDFIKELSLPEKSHPFKKWPKWRDLEENVTTQSVSIENMEDSGGISWLTLSLAVIILFLIVYMSCAKLMKYCERRDYKEIVN